ncbi:RAY1 [Symbiodinium sp. CCMP2456]|nr:RAY1 [Symbiodinium sp. CCMP2456]
MAFSNLSVSLFADPDRLMAEHLANRLSSLEKFVLQIHMSLRSCTEWIHLQRCSIVALVLLCISTLLCIFHTVALVFLCKFNPYVSLHHPVELPLQAPNGSEETLARQSSGFAGTSSDVPNQRSSAVGQPDLAGRSVPQDMPEDAGVGHEFNRYVLSIGCDDYGDLRATAAYNWARDLASPVQDADLIDEAFEKIGYTCACRLRNVTREHFWASFENFLAGLDCSCYVVAFFFAGHGIEAYQDELSRLALLLNDCSSPHLYLDEILNRLHVRLDELLHTSKEGDSVRHASVLFFCDVFFCDMCREGPGASVIRERVGKLPTPTRQQAVIYSCLSGGRAEDCSAGAGKCGHLAKALADTVKENVPNTVFSVYEILNQKVQASSRQRRRKLPGLHTPIISRQKAELHAESRVLDDQYDIFVDVEQAQQLRAWMLKLRSEDGRATMNLWQVQRQSEDREFRQRVLVERDRFILLQHAHGRTRLQEDLETQQRAKTFQEDRAKRAEGQVASADERAKKAVECADQFQEQVREQRHAFDGLRHQATAFEARAKKLETAWLAELHRASQAEGQLDTLSLQAKELSIKLQVSEQHAQEAELDWERRMQEVELAKRKAMVQVQTLVKQCANLEQSLQQSERELMKERDQSASASAQVKAAAERANQLEHLLIAARQQEEQMLGERRRSEECARQAERDREQAAMAVQEIGQRASFVEREREQIHMKMQDVIPRVESAQRQRENAEMRVQDVIQSADLAYDLLRGQLEVELESQRRRAEKAEHEAASACAQAGAAMERANQAEKQKQEAERQEKDSLGKRRRAEERAQHAEQQLADMNAVFEQQKQDAQQIYDMVASRGSVPVDEVLETVFRNVLLLLLPGLRRSSSPSAAPKTGELLTGLFEELQSKVGFLQGSVGGFVGAPELPTTTTTSTVNLAELFRQHAGLYEDKSRAPELGHVLLLTAANSGYVDMLENWECFARKLGLDWLVIAMDDELHRRMPNRSFPSIGQHYEGNANFGSNGFMVVACNKLRSVLYVLATGLYDVVFTDSDNVFRSDPFASNVSLGSLMRAGTYDYVYGVKFLPPGIKPGDHFGEKSEPNKANTGFYYVAGRQKPRLVTKIFNISVDWCDRRPHLDDQENFWDSLVVSRQRKKRNPEYVGCFQHCESTACASEPPEQTFTYCLMNPFENVLGCVNPEIALKEPFQMITYHATHVFGKTAKQHKLRRAQLWDPC